MSKEKDITDDGPEKPAPYNPNFARFMDWLENFREETVPEILTTVTEDRDKEREQKDRDNRRAFILLMTVISILTIMWITAFIVGQAQTASDILLVLLGTGMGSGISSFAKN